MEMDVDIEDRSLFEIIEGSMKGIFVRNDGIMVRAESNSIDEIWTIKYSNGKERLSFNRSNIDLNKEDFYKEFPLEMGVKQIIKNIQSGDMKFEGETKQESIDFFTK